MNKVFISGNLTRDPEVRYTQTGKAMARMGIAVQRRISRAAADSGQQTVDFFNLTAWDKTAEFCSRYLSKGSRVLVEGRLQTYSYESQDGTKKSGVDIIVDNIEFAENKRNNSDGTPSRQDYGDSPSSSKNSKQNFDDDFAGEYIADEDVPF